MRGFLYFIGCFLVVFLIVLAAALIAVGLRRLFPFKPGRRICERLIVGQIAAVVRQDLPLATALSLAAESERGFVRQRLALIARFLSQGLLLSRAVRLGYPDCPGMVLSLITAGEHAGQLPAALEQAEHFLLERDSESNRIDPSVVPYALIVTTWTLLVMSSVMIVVAPKINEIYEDFQVHEPTLLMDLARGTQRFMPSIGLVLATLLIGGIVTLYLSVRPRRVPRLGWGSRLADWVRWHTPGLRRLQFGAGIATTLRTMRFAARAGMGLDQAARLASDLDVNWYLRKRMTRFARQLSAGTIPQEAAASARLGEVAAVALGSACRSGDMSAALRYAADYHSAVISRWWAVCRNLAWPIVTLALASVIAVMAYALFQPLLLLIDAVVGPGGG